MSVDSPEDLYGLALDRFVPSRAALVKRLRGEKRREEASEVGALRKPSVAAWAVNQLVRTQPKALQALFASGDDLARAQEQATTGKGGGDAMRDATHRQRDAVRELLEAANGLLNSDGQGVSPATMDRIGETLRAAANDADARQQVAGGCLTRELRFIGVGIGGLAPTPVKREPSARTVLVKETPPSGGTDKTHTERRGRRKPKDETTARGQEAEATRKAEAEAAAVAERVAARERAAALKAGRRTEAEARRAAARAEKELAAAQARHEEAVASLRDAETLLAGAVRRAQDAAAKLTAAEQALKDLAQSRS